MKDMKYLIVVAHPDDEVLGAGASIKKWAAEGGSKCFVSENRLHACGDKLL